MSRDRREGQGVGPASQGQSRKSPVTTESVAEAAVWIARLHGPDRSRYLERECLAWQAESEENRLAFERCTDLWMDVAGVDRVAVERAVAANRHARSVIEQEASEPSAVQRFRGWKCPSPWLLALSGSAIAVLVSVLMHQPWRNIETLETRLGEQRLVVLADGTRISLNTSTRVQVELDQARRSVSVLRGEALFEVAKDASRPFVVSAAGTEVTAMGTSFLVRVAPSNSGAPETLDVMLVEGQVIVQSQNSKPRKAIAQPIVMVPGDRLRVRSDDEYGRLPLRASTLQTDRPSMEQMLAWRRGEAIFDGVSLQEALAEMNRYSAVPIRTSPAIAGLRISGSYKTGDSEGFARAVAKLHELNVSRYPTWLELAPK